MIKYIILISLFTLASAFIDIPLEASEAVEKPDIILWTDHFPPLTYQNDKGEFIGTADLIIQNLFKKAKLTYQTTSLPWKRALLKLEQQDNVLIFPLSRTKPREDKYVWIAPLFRLEMKTYGLKHQDNEIDITRGYHRFACIKTTINCLAVDSLNVPDSAISVISNISANQLVNMVAQGHVDFIMLTEIEFNFSVKKLNLDAKLFTEMTRFNYVATDYLAARKGFNHDIIKKLTAAVSTLPKIIH